MADLCLGTAQLGMKYGINNKVGKPDKAMVWRILNTAVSQGIEVIDTASVYGESEQLIGDFFYENPLLKENVKIVTKQCNSVENLDVTEIEKVIRAELETSLRALRCDFIDAYLLHSYREIDNSATIDILQKLKSEGLVKKIGVSVYEVEEAYKAMDLAMIDYLQMPCSIFDQRGLQSGLFQNARKNGVKIFTRSAFLQGLLMMEPNEVPTYLRDIIPYLIKFNELIRKYSLDKKHAIVRFILEESRIDYLVFGVETETQLCEILSEKVKEYLPVEFVEEVYNNFCNIPEKLILPVHWGK